MTVKNTEKLEKSLVALTIEVGAEEFETAIQKAYKKVVKNVRVPGFRPGKAPRKIVEKMYGAEVFYNDAIDAALPDAYEAALKETSLRVVGYPTIELVEQPSADGFTFKATIPVYPEVTLGEYKGLTAEKAEVSVSDEDVENRLQSLVKRETRLVSVDREAKIGDTAVIDFEGFLEGVPFEGGKGDNFNLELGSGSFVPGFEDQVVGMKAGEEKDIDITFPEQYTPELAGKAVVFKVKVLEVKENDVPEVDDEFAQDVSEFQTLAELKDDLKKTITEEREKSAQNAFADALMIKVAENLNADVPDAMVETQNRQFLDNFKMQMAQQGMPFDQYLSMMNTTEEAMLEETKETALQQVRVNLAKGAIIEAEKIEASDDEVEAEFKSMAEQYGMDIEMVKKYLRAEDVKDAILDRKAVAVIVDSAIAEKPAEKAE